MNNINILFTELREPGEMRRVVSGSRWPKGNVRPTI